MTVGEQLAECYAELTEWVRRARTEGWYEDDPRWEHVEALLDRIDDLATGQAAVAVAVVPNARRFWKAFEARMENPA